MNNIYTEDETYFASFTVKIESPSLDDAEESVFWLAAELDQIADDVVVTEFKTFNGKNLQIPYRSVK